MSSSRSDWPEVLSRAISNPMKFAAEWSASASNQFWQRKSILRRLRRRVLGLEEKGKSAILDRYITDPPDRSAPFKLFEGEWSSDVFGYGGGRAKLFEDHRIRWFEEKCGGFQGKRILELGPLEAGHTYMLAQRGADVTAIESNTRAFLKCLIVKNDLDFKAKFLLGDFQRYLSTCCEKFDFLLASGVLYHLTEPAQLLQDAARVTDTIGIWTHYFDHEIINVNSDLRHKFDAEPRIETIGARRIIAYKQSYLQALEWDGFCGGSASSSYWLTRDSLLGLLDDLGFTVSISDDHRTHQNGPAMTLIASRRPGD